MRHPVRSLLLCLSFVSASAWSAEAEPAALPPKDTVGIHLASLHFPSADYNNVNPGLYYRLAEGPVAGIYRNSVRRTSVYVGYSVQWRRFELTVGGVTGYSYGVQPLVVPSMALFTVQGVTARVAFIPSIEKRIGSNVLHLALEM